MKDGEENKTLPAETMSLIRDYLNGTIDLPCMQVLETILESSSDARKELRRQSTIEEFLQSEFSVPSDEVASPVELPSTNDSNFRRRSLAAALPWILATSVALLFFVNLPEEIVEENNDDRLPVLAMQNPATLEDDPSVQTQQTCLAILVDHVDAKFSNKELTTDIGFTHGEYKLTEGAIHLRFSNGADVVVNSPARFSISNPLTMRLDDGRIRAMVPSSARGFRIATPGIEYVDPGAEFGIFADSVESLSEMHVFAGRVYSPESERTSPAFRSGQSAAYRNGFLQSEKVDTSMFPKPGHIGLRRWQQRVRELRTSPGIIGFFPFHPDERGRLLNLANLDFENQCPPMPHGTVHNATWVGGRWPGKQSLLFEKDSAHVKLHIPGGHEELTFAAWIKADRFDFSFNVLLNSDGWQNGSVHWQIQRNGSPAFSPYHYHMMQIDRNLPTGKWIHLASTLSKRTGTGETYLNGQLIGHVQLSPETFLQPGDCQIGNWDDLGTGREPRAFRGRIDELAVWSRRLGPAEIATLVEHGRPSLVWQENE